MFVEVILTQLAGFIIGIFLLCTVPFMVLRYGWKKVFEVKERQLPPAILTDPKWGEHGYLQLPGLKVHYVEKGDRKKPLMLMLHGFPEFWFSWRHQLQCFSKDYWCVAIDNRGYGDSEKPTGIDQYHLDKLADDVKHVIQALGREKCILLGHDWGGAIGYYFAGKYPEMVDRYVVVNLPHPLSLARQLTKGWDQKLKSWYMLFFQCPIIPERFLRLGDIQTFESMMKGIQAEDRHQLIEAYKFTFRDRNAFQGPINYYRAARRYNVTHKPKLNDVPVFSVYGNKDDYLSVSAFKGSRDFVEDFQECPIEGASHWSMMEAPEKVNAAIERYLNNKNGT